MLLEHLTARDRAANIPEFVNCKPGAIAHIQERFLDDYSFARAGYVMEGAGDFDEAIAKYRKAIEMNPRNAHAHQRLGFLLYHVKHDTRAGLAETAEALKLDPDDGCAHCDLGLALSEQGQYAAAARELSLAVRLLPEGFDRRYNPADMRCWLGEALLAQQQTKEAAKVLRQAISFNPESAQSHYLLAFAFAAQGMTAEAAAEYSKAIALKAGVDTMPELHFLMSVNYEKAGEFRQALSSARKALELAHHTKRDAALIQGFEARVEECETQAARGSATSDTMSNR